MDAFPLAEFPLGYTPFIFVTIALPFFYLCQFGSWLCLDMLSCDFFFLSSLISPSFAFPFMFSYDTFVLHCRGKGDRKINDQDISARNHCFCCRARTCCLQGKSRAARKSLAQLLIWYSHFIGEGRRSSKHLTKHTLTSTHTHQHGNTWRLLRSWHASVGAALVACEGYISVGCSADFYDKPANSLWPVVCWLHPFVFTQNNSLTPSSTTKPCSSNHWPLDKAQSYLFLIISRSLKRSKNMNIFMDLTMLFLIVRALNMLTTNHSHKSKQYWSANLIHPHLMHNETLYTYSVSKLRHFFIFMK